MKANVDTLKQKLEIIDENIEFLNSEKEGFRPEEAAFKDIQAVKHSMLEAAEACLDIASHIIASEGFERPKEYSEMFETLEINGVIGEELASDLSEMARFRNFLVHRYDKVDNQRLEEFLEKDIDDIKEFSSEIYSYIEKQ